MASASVPQAEKRRHGGGAAASAAGAGEFWKRVGSTEFCFRVLRGDFPRLTEACDEIEREAIESSLAEVGSEAAAREQGGATVVASVAAGDDGEMSRRVRLNQPFVVRNYARGRWKNWDKWADLSIFEDIDPDVHVDTSGTVADTESKTCDPGARGTGPCLESISLQTFIASLKQSSGVAGRCGYLRLWYYLEERGLGRDLSQDMQMPAAFEDHLERLPRKMQPVRLPRWVFLGPNDTVSPLHVDPFASHAWFVQVAGAKRFLLYPPDCMEALADGTRFVDPSTPDLDAFPNFPAAQEHQLDVTIEAGDLLFLPSNWIHEVRASSEPLDGSSYSLSVSHNFVDSVRFKMIRILLLMDRVKRFAAPAAPQ